MTILVQKYGGSSVADVAKIGVVADKVVAARKDGTQVVVVVSAMGKTTDGLVQLAKQVAGGSEPQRRELDMLVSTGERVTMALLSIALHARGCDAISFTGSQSGIITNDRHFDARIIEVRPHRIEDELSRGRVVIVAGYQGMSYRREITTLGRGGSDTTAVALAAALGADCCEIYSDVDGVYTADPRIVPEVSHLPELGLDVLSEMAEAGAKVLNAQAVEWARRNKVSIVARRTSDNASAAATRETIARAESDKKVRAVVGLDRVVRVSQREGELLGVCQRLGLQLLDVWRSEGGTDAVIPLLNVPDWEACEREIRATLGTPIELESGLALVSLVGDGLLGPDSVAESVGAELAQHNIAVRKLTASPLRISVLVESLRLDDAQRVLHAAFVASAT